MLEQEAKEKHCWRIGGKCLGQGCMSWQVHGQRSEVEVPWPEDVPKPDLADLGSAGSMFTPAEAGQEARVRANRALRAIDGQRHEGRLITRADPSDIRLTKVRLHLISDDNGYCLEQKQ